MDYADFDSIIAWDWWDSLHTVTNVHNERVQSKLISFHAYFRPGTKFKPWIWFRPPLQIQVKKLKMHRGTGHWTNALKPMDSFGKWWKWKLFVLFCFVNAEFYRVVWTINALLTVRSKMLPFSENNQNIEMFGGSPNTLPYRLCT